MNRAAIDLKKIIELFNGGKTFFDDYNIFWKNDENKIWEDWIKITADHKDLKMIFNNCVFNFKLIFYEKNDIIFKFFKCEFKAVVEFFGDCKEIGFFNSIFLSDLEIASDSIKKFYNGNNIYHKDILFQMTGVLEDEIIFNKCEIKGIGYFRNLNFGTGTRFFDCVLTNYSFTGSNIRGAQFINCTFDFKNLVDERILDLNDKPELTRVIELYRNFESVYDEQKHYEYSGKFHKKRFKLEGKLKKNPFNYLYLWFSNYGESYWRSFIWIIGSIFLIFPLIYLFTGLNYIDKIQHPGYEDEIVKRHIQYWNPWSDNPHFEFGNDYGLAIGNSINSSVAFSKDVFVKEVEPLNNWTLGWSIFQRLLVPILVTLFIIALRRKFKR